MYPVTPSGSSHPLIYRNKLAAEPGDPVPDVGRWQECLNVNRTPGHFAPIPCLPRPAPGTPREPEYRHIAPIPRFHGGSLPMER